jgi:transketolase
MRNTFISSLVDHAAQDENIILMVGDLGFGAVEPFQESFPSRFFNVGIAEQNMAGMAAGLASRGFHVFNYSIGNFPTFRAAEHIRNDIDYHNFSVTTVSIGGGVSYGSLGYSHHTFQDFSLMRSFPNTIILAPCDPEETMACLSYILKFPQPSYLRLGKNGEKKLTSKSSLKPGFPNLVKMNNSRSLILSTGTALQSIGINEDADIFTVPIWGQSVDTSEIECLLSSYDDILICEDHLLSGGFYSWIVENLKNKQLFVKMRSKHYGAGIIGDVGSRDYLEKSNWNEI